MLLCNIAHLQGMFREAFESDPRSAAVSSAIRQGCRRANGLCFLLWRGPPTGRASPCHKLSLPVSRKCAVLDSDDELDLENMRLTSGCMQMGHSDLGAALKNEIQRLAGGPVSYTHLTLPTIYSV